MPFQVCTDAVVVSVTDPAMAGVNAADADALTVCPPNLTVELTPAAHSTLTRLTAGECIGQPRGYTKKRQCFMVLHSGTTTDSDTFGVQTVS